MKIHSLEAGWHPFTPQTAARGGPLDRLELSSPPGSEKARPPNPATPPTPPEQEEETSSGGIPWKAALGAAAAAVAALAGIFGPVILSGTHLIQQPVSIQVRRGHGRWLYSEPPGSLEGKEVHVRVEVPLELRDRGSTSVQVFAYDAWGRRQGTRWTSGQPVAENHRYDPSTGILELVYRPAPDPAGAGFSSHLPLATLGVQVNAEGEGLVRLLEVRVKDSWAREEAPVVRPLVRIPAPPARPTPVSELKTGVSRYFDYGDLHRWEEVRPRMEQALQEQHDQGLTAFRWMGGVDARRGSGGLRLGPREFQAMREALRLAEEHGQKDFIFTLLDGAIPNETLRQAMVDSGARKRLIDELRPFLREFGTAKVGGQPIILDLVNEIHGIGDVTDRQRQRLVEDMIRAVVQEAPGATVTVGVQNFRELTAWTHLSDTFRRQPVRIVYTFHLWEDIDAVPAASALNLPEGAEVGITEAAPSRGVERQLSEASRKGYRWMLFWQDARHPYSPAEHHQALERIQGTGGGSANSPLRGPTQTPWDRP
ncbi:MAG: hypothetical protein AB1758_00890 [Candidatus Eremiobacterota bacterium]